MDNHHTVFDKMTIIDSNTIGSNWWNPLLASSKCIWNKNGYAFGVSKIAKG
jgi:hypothetical protein